MNSPDFIIAGERRSGSTTLYELLKQHSEIELYPSADMDYFIKPELFKSKKWIVAFDDDEEWYASHSKEQYKTLFKGLDFSKKVGQKDADLLFWKKSHERLASYLPNTKFVFVLRNPIKRAESHYWNEFGKGRESLNYEEAIKEETKRSKESDYGKLHLNYVERGRYIESLKHFLTYVPQERVQIIILEKLLENTAEELEKLASFLGISSQEASQLELVHSNKEEVMVLNPALQGTVKEKLINNWDRVVNGLIVRYSKQKDVRAKLRKKYMHFGKISMRDLMRPDPVIRERLKEYYKKPNLDLAQFLGIDLSCWT